jgi:hypothetical protein
MERTMIDWKEFNNALDWQVQKSFKECEPEELEDAVKMFLDSGKPGHLTIDTYDIETYDRLYNYSKVPNPSIIVKMLKTDLEKHFDKIEWEEL